MANSDRWQTAGVDTVKASEMLKRWVEQGVLLCEDASGKRHTVSSNPIPDSGVGAVASLSLSLDNGQEK